MDTFTLSRRSRKLLVFLAVISISPSILAQIPAAPKTLQSPAAAAFSTHGDIPVSLFTGKPDINVNLHTITDHKLEIPIALNYDASGVRPDAHPGWVGLNFNLSTHYAVTRTIRDGPDDCPYQDSRGKLGYFLAAGLVNDNNWNTSAGIKSIVDNSFLGRDLEPDEFAFNLPGISGKFYWGHDGKFKVLCDRPVKVKLSSNVIDTAPPFIPPSNTHITANYFSVWRNEPNYRLHAKGFIITDESGNKYEFGGSNAFAEYGIDFFAQGAETWNCNAWYLKSITQVTGQVTNFTYERGAMVAQMYFSLYQGQYKVGGGGFLDAECENNPSLFPVNGPVNGKLISPIYLKEISGTNYKVKFTSTQSMDLRYDEAIFAPYVNWNKSPLGNNNQTHNILLYLYSCYYPVRSPSCVETDPPLADLLATLQWRKLDKIEIQTPGGVTVKEFGFTYNNLPNERLMLQSVQEKSGAKVVPPYVFSYFSSPGVSLPFYARSHTDHWGFNNGKPITAPDFSIPNFYTAYGDTFRSPDADSKYVKAGSLTRIKYPTGGMTDFVFEPHTYSKEVKLARWTGLDSYPSNKLAGGLRVREIKSYDPNIAGSEVVKTYSYVAGFNPLIPNAALLSSGVLGGKAQYYFTGYTPKPNDNFTYTQNIFSTQSVLPGSENSYGSHIGYSEVVEATSTGGWTVHKFSNFDNGYLDTQASGTLQTGFTAYQPYNSTANQRGKKLSEEKYHANGSRVSKNVYQYALTGALADYSARAERTLLTYLCDGDHRVYEGTAYLIDVRPFLPSQEVYTIYDQDNPAQYSAATTKNYKYWPNGQLHIQSETDSRGEEIKTRYQYPPNFPDAVHVAMTSRNQIGTASSTLTYTGPDNAPVTLRQQQVDFGLFNGFYLPKKVSSGVGTVLPVTLSSDIDFLTYDIRGNLLTYKERNGMNTKLEYFGPADVGKTDLLKKRTVSDGAAEAQAVSYDHKTLAGIQSITDPNSKATFYEYDELGRLANIRDNNAGGVVRASYCYNYAGQPTPCTALAPTGSIAASSLVLIASELPLPVTLIRFEAVKKEAIAVLTWTTSFETNADRFEIEHSENGKTWKQLGIVMAAGESTDDHTYSFDDSKPLKGENLYRLKMVDRDDTFAYSQIRSLVFSDSEAEIYPNPVSVGKKLNLTIGDLGTVRSIQFFDSAGKMVLQSPVARTIDTDRLIPGLYIMQITFLDGSVSTHRVVKQ
ncbi:T9SS type A sorting domain-containing protein [Dyadobacter aurulentus]|uniref:T9SS type A sorting domain-containing protein n=1 Tax=Dyadobacter sp. UC 10 TaxID=2605428 RepID=UPI001788D85F|nr:T9SS type A sorting domain-containing protein [Dyadobacter sp. UC 10]